MPRLILASSSPRRKTLLEQLGLDFDIIVSEIEEKVEGYSTPEEAVKSLAYQKAFNVASTVDEGLVLGSDTIVTINNKILGKPNDKEEVFAMLKLLSGKVHKVITGVCLINVSDGSYLLESDTSLIKFREIDDNEINAYINSNEPFDKAGSYAIQGLGAVFVERIEGSYTGIVGLPLFIVDKMLKYYGVSVLNN